MPDFRKLPKIDKLAGSPRLEGFVPEIRVLAARMAVAAARTKVASGGALDADEIEQMAAEEAERLQRPSVRRVINASGVILHTGLGRARLATAAVNAVCEASANHSAVEIDLSTGERGDRQTHVRELLCELTGAADALAVNNCAAAVFLTLRALAAPRPVLLSRGQMVEIGGSFRMPDVVRESGCDLIEVGCTNKTRIGDYDSVSEVGAILRCHPSNFKIVGFSEQPTLEQLAEVARQKKCWLIDDLGSGALSDLGEFGLARTETMSESLRAGADVVLSSGDKLLGGPQAGLILGSKSAIETIRRHPLARAVRIDKLTLAALAATLRLLVLGRRDDVPTWWALGRDLQSIKKDAAKLKKAYVDAILEIGGTEIGGGSAPGETLPTWRTGLKSSSADSLAHRLRTGVPSILGRIERGLVWLDPRTMDKRDVDDTCRVLREIARAD